MSDLRELYQEVILDHHRRPRNCRRIEGATRHVEGHNPLCGDRVTVYVKVDGDRLQDVAFEGSGCAISTASASMMTEALKGRTLVEAERTFQAFHRMLTSDADDGPGQLGKLAAFGGVRQFPLRVKCATLAWHTLHAALEGADQTVSTE